MVATSKGILFEIPTKEIFSGNLSLAMNDGDNGILCTLSEVNSNSSPKSKKFKIPPITLYTYVYAIVLCESK